MKTIALLAIGAALALAADQDGQKASDTKTTNTKATDTKSPSAAASTMKARQSTIDAPSQPAKRKIHQPTVNPAEGKLTPAQQSAAALPTVPPGAQEVGSNLYRFTDPQGKVWMYRKTPFGVSKWEEKPGEQNPQAESPASPGATTGGTATSGATSSGTTMTDLGDSVQFQRATPFGLQKWTRKKSEMTDDEKAAFATQEHAKQAALGNKAAAAAKPPEQK
jgi:hypothetical protein